MLAGYQ